MQPLLIIGAGGMGRETAEAVRAINRESPAWDLLGFLDDGLAARGEPVIVDDLPVLGPIADVSLFPDARVVVTIGSPQNFLSRRRIVRALELSSDRYATIIHPAAVIPCSAMVGPGTVILATAVATSPVVIGAHVMVMPAVVLTHDDRVEDFATLASGVRLAGGVRIGEGAYIGAGALIREQRSIGRWALVGMGAAVTRDIPAGQVWAGIPARYLRDGAGPDVAAKADR